MRWSIGVVTHREAFCHMMGSFFFISYLYIKLLFNLRGPATIYLTHYYIARFISLMRFLIHSVSLI